MLWKDLIREKPEWEEELIELWESWQDENYRKQKLKTTGKSSEEQISEFRDANKKTESGRKI